MESPTLKLVMLQGPREGETLDFAPGKSIRIGRVVRGNTVPIKDTGISTKHLTIEFESGKWVITDLDSSNGTLLNDVRLPPLAPHDLRHGDSVKVGEDTSIKVEFGEEVVVDQPDGAGDEKSRLRRNPRRRKAAVPNLEKQDVMKGRRGRLGSLQEEDDDGIEGDSIVGIPEPVVPNAGPVTRKRGRPAAAALRKSNEVSSVSEVGADEGSKDVELAGHVSRKRGRPAAAELRKNNEVSSMSEVGDDEGSKDVELAGQVLENKGARYGLRRGKSSTKDVELVAESKPRQGRPPRGAKKMNKAVVNNSTAELQEDIPNTIVGCENESVTCPLLPQQAAGMKISEANEGLKEKSNNAQDEALHSEGISRLEENVSRDNSGSHVKPLQQAAPSTGMGNMEGETPEPRSESTGTSGAKKGNVNMGDDIDWEKITLGEYLRFLEWYLPKQIIDETEEMITELEETARSVHEYKLQQKKAKGVK